MEPKNGVRQNIFVVSIGLVVLLLLIKESVMFCLWVSVFVCPFCFQIVGQNCVFCLFCMPVEPKNGSYMNEHTKISA